MGNTRPLFLVTAIILVSTILSGQEILIPKGAVWKYLDNGSDQDTIWQEQSYNDAAWKEGPAQLGYGDGDERTVVGFGPDSTQKYLTTYFRHFFTVDDTSRFKALLIRLLKDDGAVVYLNGDEVVRCKNMPTYEINYRTPTWAIAEEDEERTFFFEYDIPKDALITGQNILAVEIHQRSFYDPDISFDLELLLHDGKTFIKQPYLVFTGLDDQMRVNWQMTKQDTCFVEWGLDSNTSAGRDTTYEYSEDHLHRCIIDDLQPGTKYYYRVITSRDTTDGSFVSSPSPDVDEISFFVYGDTRDFPGRHNMVADAMVEYREQFPEFQSLLMGTGDIVNDGDLEEDWNTQFFSTAMTGFLKILATTPYISAYGNHEESGVLYRKYFPLPWVSAEGFYFSFDYGPAHFALLDIYGEYTEGSDQYAWIADDLAGSDKRWKFIFAHRAGWSAGGHRDPQEIRDYIQPLCEEYGVQIFFAGHNHNYARAEANGVQHVTTGGGGAPINPPDSTNENIVAVADEYHFTAVRINGDSLNVQAINSNGEILDEFMISWDLVHHYGVHTDLITSVRNTLSLAYPNPFYRSTTISYSIASEMKVNISVYNIYGQKIATLVNRVVASGNHDVIWQGQNDRGEAVAPGLYFYRMHAEGFLNSHSMVFMK
ncbi:MAG: metallophosphoesterase [Bacteroidota bacterium]